MKKHKILIGAVKIKAIIIASLLLGSILLAITLPSVLPAREAKTSPSIGIKIVLDAGHGGIDPGSVGRKTKITESELNLKITFELKSLLNAMGIDVVLTRSDENGLYGVYSKDYKKRDMTARKEIIEKANPDIIVSIHMNSYTSSNYRGAQVFYKESNDCGEILATCVQNCFASDLAESNKGISIGDYYILNCTTKPAILCECGYLSNAYDEQLLVDCDYQKKIAYSIFRGIVGYLNSML